MRGGLQKSARIFYAGRANDPFFAGQVRGGLARIATPSLHVNRESLVFG